MKPNHLAIALLALVSSALGQANPAWEAANLPKFWRTYNPPPVGMQLDNTSTLGSILSRLNPTDRQAMMTKYANDLGTQAHEATHKLDDQIARAMGGSYCAFYLGAQNGYCVVFREPRIHASQVIPFVPQQYRDTIYFQNYLVMLPQQPGYPTSQIIDEWVAAINGWQATIELGVRDTGDARMSRQFVAYGDAYLMAIRTHEPNYPDLAGLACFIDYLKAEVSRMSARTYITRKVYCDPITNEWCTVEEPIYRESPNRITFNGGGSVGQPTQRPPIAATPPAQQPTPPLVAAPPKIEPPKPTTPAPIASQPTPAQPPLADKDYVVASAIFLSQKIDALAERSINVTCQCKCDCNCDSKESGITVQTYNENNNAINANFEKLQASLDQLTIKVGSIGSPSVVVPARPESGPEPPRVTTYDIVPLTME